MYYCTSRSLWLTAFRIRSNHILLRAHNAQTLTQSTHRQRARAYGIVGVQLASQERAPNDGRTRCAPINGSRNSLQKQRQHSLSFRNFIMCWDTRNFLCLPRRFRFAGSKCISSLHVSLSLCFPFCLLTSFPYWPCAAPFLRHASSLDYVCTPFARRCSIATSRVYSIPIAIFLLYLSVPSFVFFLIGYG